MDSLLPGLRNLRSFDQVARTRTLDCLGSVYGCSGAVEDDYSESSNSIQSTETVKVLVQGVP